MPADLSGGNKLSTLERPQETRTIGQTGIQLSALAWGTWRLADTCDDTGEAALLLRAALDAGITLIDTADIYGFGGPNKFGHAESLIGEVLARDPALKSKLIVATKGGIRPPIPYDQSPAYLADAIDASLRRLRTETIDLYQIHRPDILAHPEETARALENAVSSGKVCELGVSNFTAPQIDALTAFLDVPLATTQPEISPLRITPFENGEMDQAMRLGMAPLAWSPLGGGRIIDPQCDQEKAVVDALDKIALERGVSRCVAAYAWLMAHPAGIIPIIGSLNPGRIAEAAKAIEMQWTREDWYAILVAARGQPLP